MAAPLLPSFSRDDYPADAPEWLDKLLGSLQTLTGGQSEQLDKGLTFTENFAAQVKPIRFTGLEIPWTTFTLAGTWVRFSNALCPPQYRMTPGGITQLRFAVKSGTAGTDIAAAGAIPAGYQPEFDLNFTPASNATDDTIRIGTDGTIDHSIGTSTSLIELHCQWQAVASGSTPVASPPRFTTGGYPMRIKHSLRGKVTGVIPMYGKTLTNAAPAGIGQPYFDWENGNAGEIVIHAIYGVSPGQTYEMNLLLVTR